MRMLDENKINEIEDERNHTSFGHGFGCIPSNYDVRDYRIAYSADLSSVPDTFCYDVLEIKNQGHFQTCVAHVLSEVVEFHNYKDAGAFTQFSTEFIYGFRNIDTDDDYVEEGMYIRDALKIINKYGDVTYNDLPGNHTVPVAMGNVKASIDRLKELAYPNRISTYYKVKSVQEVKHALYHNGPVVIGMKWYPCSNITRDGYLNYFESDDHGYHAVMIIGYDEDSFIIQNSWGKAWGLDGTFKLKFEDYPKLVKDAYGVTDDITYVRKPVEKFNNFAKLINIFVNIILKMFMFNK